MALLYSPSPYTYFFDESLVFKIIRFGVARGCVVRLVGPSVDDAFPFRLTRPRDSGGHTDGQSIWVVCLKRMEKLFSFSHVKNGLSFLLSYSFRWRVFQRLSFKSRHIREAFVRNVFFPRLSAGEEEVRTDRMEYSLRFQRIWSPNIYQAVAGIHASMLHCFKWNWKQ